MGKPIPITISNATIRGSGGEISNATITGDAELQTEVPPMPPGDFHPAHPILTPPGDAPEGSFWLLVFCPNPPPPHWEWILFTPGSPPERPHPQPPDPPEVEPPDPEVIKPFPPDGGWGFAKPWGWIYWPGPEGAGPRRRK